MVLAAYLAAQRIVCGLHAGVEAVISRRASGGRVRSEDRASYQRLFYWPVRGWNLLGDNTRFYAIGVLAWLHRAADFPLFVLGPMNAAFVMLWVWQARRDGRFLTESCGTGPSAL